MTIVEFLRARYDEDEAVARAATSGPWSVDDTTYAESISRDEDGYAVVAGGRWGGEASVFGGTDDAIHIARFNPARVLREVEAKRRIVDDAAEAIAFADRDNDSAAGYLADTYERVILPALALPYSDHPDYDPAWAI